MRLSAVLVPGLLVLAACTVGPDFHQPAVVAPLNWAPNPDGTGSQLVEGGMVDPRWWLRLDDPVLDDLVERITTENLDLRVAAERVVQARALRNVAAAQGLPKLSAQGQYTRTRQSPNGFISLVEPSPGAPLEYDLWQAGLSASWELDLFGRVRRSVEAADATALATEEARRGLALSILAELTQDYLQLRGTQALLDVAERNIQAAQQNAALVHQRFGQGLGTTLDVAQAEAQLAGITATVPPLRARQATLINAVGLLLGRPPRALDTKLRPRAPIPAMPPTISVGLPGGLVRRRPDVREAEAQLHAATALTGVAVASFYPDVTLTGLADFNGLKALDLFSLPSRAWEVGPSITIPLFQGGRLTGQLRLAQSFQRQAAVRFQKTVLAAWQEADDAITTYAEAQERRQQTAKSVFENTRALEAARQRYRQGASDFLNVVAAEQSLLSAENQLAQDDTQIANDLVALYRALGGGWEVADSDVSAPRGASCTTPGCPGNGLGDVGVSRPSIQ